VGQLRGVEVLANDARGCRQKPSAAPFAPCPRDRTHYGQNTLGDGTRLGAIGVMYGGHKLSIATALREDRGAP
jgi:hypothetical protein